MGPAQMNKGELRDVDPAARWGGWEGGRHSGSITGLVTNHPAEDPQQERAISSGPQQGNPCPTSPTTKPPPLHLSR